MLIAASAFGLLSSVTNVGGFHGDDVDARVLTRMSEPPAPPARELVNHSSRSPTARNGWSSTAASASSVTTAGVDHGPPTNGRVAL